MNKVSDILAWPNDIIAWHLSEAQEHNKAIRENLHEQLEYNSVVVWYTKFMVLVEKETLAHSICKRKLAEYTERENESKILVNHHTEVAAYHMGVATHYLKCIQEH